MLQFNSLRSRGNYANAGRAAADSALRLFIAARRSSPDYGQLAQKGAQLRAEEKKQMIQIKGELASRAIQVESQLKANRIEMDAKRDAKKDSRKAGLLAAAGRSGGIGLMKMGEKPLERRDGSDYQQYFDTQTAKVKAEIEKYKNGIPTISKDIDEINPGNQQGDPQPGKATEVATASVIPKVTPVSPIPQITTASPSNINISKLDQQKLDIIGKYESDPVGGYNAINQIGIKDGRGVLGYSGDIRKMPQHGGRSLTNFTVGEIMDLQADPGKSMSNEEWIKSGKLHAVGRYQFIGPTFKSEVQRQGIDLNSKFTPQLQDQLALGYLNHVGSVSPWIGPMDKATADEMRILNTF